MVTYDARPSAFTQLGTTSDWEALFSAAGCWDGIDGTQSSTFTPSLDTGGRNVVIQAGNVILKGQLWRADAAVSTPIPAASAQNRIDRLVLRINRGASTSPTVIQPVVITGTPSGSPVEPPLTQTPTGIYDIPVCSWTSASTGALSGLVDERLYGVDVWHNLAVPSSPVGLTGIFRYKLVAPDIVRCDINLTWTANNTWSFPSLLYPYEPSVPGGYARIYAQLGNGNGNFSINGGFPRMYFGGGGGIQFISSAVCNTGQGCWTLDIPTD